MTFECKDGTPETGSHWIHLGEGKPEVWIDFHHTFTTKCGACPDEDLESLCAGEPQKGLKEALQAIRDMDFKIVIYSGYGKHIRDTVQGIKDIYQWLEENNLDKLVDEIRANKPTWAFFIGDRAIHHKSWSESLRALKIRSSMKAFYSMEENVNVC